MLTIHPIPSAEVEPGCVLYFPDIQVFRLVIGERTDIINDLFPHMPMVRLKYRQEAPRLTTSVHFSTVEGTLAFIRVPRNTTFIKVFNYKMD